jgi:hypothetical protein
MITCVVDYVIDPKKIDVFEQFAKRWIDLVNRYGVISGIPKVLIDTPT